MIARYKGKKAFKVGAEARIVHERVSNLKRISVNHSLLYNFSTEGAFCDMEIPVGLYGPTPQDSVALLQAQLQADGELGTRDLLRNIQAQILVDRLEWISGDVIRNKACPRCGVDKVDSGPEEITPAFIDHISPKLISKDFYEKKAASNIKR